jgi:hypothetical protein
MVLKVSVTLPGGAVISLETSDPNLYQEVIGMAFRELPKNLLQISPDGAPPAPMPEVSKDVYEIEAPSDGKVSEAEAAAIAATAAAATNEVAAPAPSDEDEEAGRETSDNEGSFSRFCESLAPIGDMRRLVVAAEGARRFLNVESVSENELGALFDMAGWRQPGNFLQSLRNAARSKFGWVERVPGTTGYYAITQVGRDSVIGDEEGQ